MHMRRWLIAVLAAVVSVSTTLTVRAADPDSDVLLPDDKLKTPAHLETPISYVSRNQLAEWDKLKSFWNVVEEKVVDPTTGKEVVRNAVKIKLPLGLNLVPPVPPENPLTLEKWQLGKKLYFDPILSSNGEVSCASCHDPATGYSNHTRVSTGIGGKKGGANSPTVINSVYNRFQFWDGRADSLEHQAQGPVGNSVEMFDGKGEAWAEAVKRLRAKPEYVAEFQKVFGHLPTRDAVAKAIATYERTVLSGNSLSDRADVAMRARVEDEESTNFTVLAKDYEKVINDAIKAKDTYALEAIGYTPESGVKVSDLASSIANGRALFFGKARCTSCHVGESFTDHQFHNLGVGAVDGKLPKDAAGRFGSQPLGAKNPEVYGAFKTPPLRHLLGTKPYMHDGSEATLEAVIDLYDRGGNPNEYLSPKMRDLDAEKAYLTAKATGTEYKGPKVYLCGPNQKPIVPFALNLTAQEKKDLVLYMKSLQGDPIAPIVAEAERMK